MANIYSPLPKQYHTLTGKPLHGKVEYRDAITSNLLNTYTFDKVNGFTPARNPVYTDVYGQVEQVFTANTLVLVSLYSYIGNHTDMTIDFRPEAWVHEYDYYAHFDVEQNESKNYYVGISGLANAPIEDGQVTVVGYRDSTDCMARTYVWDPKATDDEDGGYVFKSNHSETGRWILVWNQESLPNEIYGVTTNDYTNLNNFLSYKSSVGTKQIPTCRQIEFTNFKLPSDYSYTLNTTKCVKCSRDCYFGTGQFKVNDIEVLGNDSGRLGNFYITKTQNNTVVLLSWYTSAQYFFWSNANKLIYDDISKLDQNKITSDVTLSGCTLEFTRDWSTQLTAKLTLDSVHLIMNTQYYLGEENTDKVYLKNMTVDTRNFRKLKVSHCTNCVIDVRNTFNYDMTTKSSNSISLYKPGYVEVTGKPFDYVDTDWFAYYEDGTFHANPICHGTARWQICYIPSNATNIDITDCKVLDMTGWTGSTLNLNLNSANHGNPNITIRGLKNNIKLQFTVTPNTAGNVTIEDCDIILRRINPIVAKSINIKFVNSNITLKDSNFYALGNNVTFVDSTLTEDRDFPEREETESQYLDPFHVYGNFYGYRSNFYLMEISIYEGEFEAERCNFYKASKETPFYTKAELQLKKFTNVTNCYMKNITMFYLGDDNAHNVLFSGNTLSTSRIGAYNGSDSKIVSFTATGNNVESGSDIYVVETATPSKYVIENNGGLKKSTNFKHLFDRGQSGVIEFGRYGSTIDSLSEGKLLEDYRVTMAPKDTKGCAQEIFDYMRTYCYFVPPVPEGKSVYQHLTSLPAWNVYETITIITGGTGSSTDGKTNFKVQISVERAIG